MKLTKKQKEKGEIVTAQRHGNGYAIEVLQDLDAETHQLGGEFYRFYTKEEGVSLTSEPPHVWWLPETVSTLYELCEQFLMVTRPGGHTRLDVARMQAELAAASLGKIEELTMKEVVAC